MSFNVNLSMVFNINTVYIVNMEKSRPLCPNCGSTKTIIHHYRKSKLGKKIIYRCKECKSIFTPNNGLFKRRINQKIVDRILDLRFNGHSNKHIIQDIKKRHKIQYSRQTIWKICKEFKEGYISRFLNDLQSNYDEPYWQEFVHDSRKQLREIIKKNLPFTSDNAFEKIRKESLELFRLYIKKQEKYKDKIYKERKKREMDWSDDEPIDDSYDQNR